MKRNTKKSLFIFGIIPLLLLLGLLLIWSQSGSRITASAHSVNEMSNAIGVSSTCHGNANCNPEHSGHNNYAYAGYHYGTRDIPYSIGPSALAVFGLEAKQEQRFFYFDIDQILLRKLLV